MAKKHPEDYKFDTRHLKSIEKGGPQFLIQLSDLAKSGQHIYCEGNLPDKAAAALYYERARNHPLHLVNKQALAALKVWLGPFKDEKSHQYQLFNFILKQAGQARHRLSQANLDDYLFKTWQNHKNIRNNTPTDQLPLKVIETLGLKQYSDLMHQVAKLINKKNKLTPYRRHMLLKSAKTAIDYFMQLPMPETVAHDQENINFLITQLSQLVCIFQKTSFSLEDIIGTENNYKQIDSLYGSKSMIATVRSNHASRRQTEATLNQLLRNKMIPNVKKAIIKPQLIAALKTIKHPLKARNKNTCALVFLKGYDSVYNFFILLLKKCFNLLGEKRIFNKKEHLIKIDNALYKRSNTYVQAFELIRVVSIKMLFIDSSY